MAVATTLEPGHVSPEEYLRREQKAEVKSEYDAGRIVAMSGGSFRHVQLIGSLAEAMRVATRGSQCRFLTSELKVRIANGPRYFYPDGTIACPPNVVDEKNGVIDNPKVVFEVLSPGTESYDRGEKFFAYAGVESVQQIVFTSSERRRTEVWTRIEGGWRPEAFTGTTLTLASVGIDVSLDDLYEDVVFPEASFDES